MNTAKHNIISNADRSFMRAGYMLCEGVEVLGTPANQPTAGQRSRNQAIQPWTA